MSRPAHVRRQVQHLLLALLTVVASFAYLTRAQTTGVMGPLGLAARVTDRSSMTMDTEVRQTTEPAVTQSRGQQSRGHPAASPEHVMAPVPAVGLMDAAPNAPPLSAHGHAAHCPFCLTAAFALEAEGALTLWVPGGWRWPAEARYVRPHVRAVRPVDARAPPVSG